MKVADRADVRYPVGRFQYAGPYSSAQRRKFIRTIEQQPRKLKAAVKGLHGKQLESRYREGGWTIRQIVHHIADSHLNGYLRLKLALTENQPAIKTYDQEAWADLADTRKTPIEVSLTLLEDLHERWVKLWNSLPPADYRKTLRHPEDGIQTVDWLLALYAWHGTHHTAHVTGLRKRMGW